MTAPDPITATLAGDPIVDAVVLAEGLGGWHAAGDSSNGKRIVWTEYYSDRTAAREAGFRLAEQLGVPYVEPGQERYVPARYAVLRLAEAHLAGNVPVYADANGEHLPGMTEAALIDLVGEYGPGLAALEALHAAVKGDPALDVACTALAATLGRMATALRGNADQAAGQVDRRENES